MRFKSYSYVFICFLYLAGRICLTATYSFSNEDKKFIFLVNLLNFNNALSRAAIQNERLTPSDIRHKKNSALFVSGYFSNAGDFFAAPVVFRSFPYSGQFIDPPKLS